MMMMMITVLAIVVVVMMMMIMSATSATTITKLAINYHTNLDSKNSQVTDDVQHIIGSQ